MYKTPLVSVHSGYIVYLSKYTRRYQLIMANNSQKQQQTL